METERIFRGNDGSWWEGGEAGQCRKLEGGGGDGSGTYDEGYVRLLDVHNDRLCRVPGGAGSGSRPWPKLEKARPIEGEAGGRERPGWGVPTTVAAFLTGEADTPAMHSKYPLKVQRVVVAFESVETFFRPPEQPFPLARYQYHPSSFSVTCLPRGVSLKVSARGHVLSLCSFHGLPESLHLLLFFLLLLFLLFLLCYVVFDVVVFLSRGFLHNPLIFLPSLRKTTACADE